MFREDDETVLNLRCLMNSLHPSFSSSNLPISHSCIWVEHALIQKGYLEFLSQ